MKEIKFRVWSKEDKSFLHADDIAIRNNGNVLIYDWHRDYRKSWSSSYDNHTIQQYTGLKDKDGNEIYEGDIVRFNEPVELSDGLFLSTLYVFEFYNGSFLRPYIYQSLNGGKFINLGENKLNPTGRAKLEDNPYFDLTKAEIVGNIFETPFEIDL